MHRFEVDIDQLDEARAAGAYLVDVRDPDEFESARVPGGRLVPLGELVERRDEIPAAGPVYVICHSGGRSLKATEYLRSQGIQAWSVAGGTKAWIDSGRIVDSGTS